MEKQIEDALREEASRQHAIDPDVVAFPIFNAVVEKVTVQGDQVTGAQEAVLEMKRLRPRLFVEQDWDEIAQDPDNYAAREEAFRAGLRRPHRVAPNEWAALDAGLLDDQELHALTRAVGGQSNSYDRALLSRALRRQKSEQGAA